MRLPAHPPSLHQVTNREKESELVTLLRLLHRSTPLWYPEPHPHRKLVPGRKLEVDVVLPHRPTWDGHLYLARPLVIEVEGGMFAFRNQQGVLQAQGAHGSVGGALRDLEKYNLLATLGYALVRVLPKQVTNGEALTLIDAMLLTLSQEAERMIGQGYHPDREEWRLIFEEPHPPVATPRRRGRVTT